jgi:hypothetical protein
MDDYMINLIQTPSTSYPTENYSIMVMESEYIVAGDDVGGGDDEEALEIPFSRVESRINLTPETKIVVSAVLCFAKHSVLMAG